jgi:stage III sporulation protein SpoIIIAA
VPHPALGSARRMQVPNIEEQHTVMLEAVQNHTPHVVLVDEIGTSQVCLSVQGGGHPCFLACMVLFSGAL